MSDMTNLVSALVSKERPVGEDAKPCVVVRLRTSCWNDHGSVSVKRTLTVLKKKSCGHDYFLDYAENAGASELIEAITNLDRCKDGVYLVDTCNVSRDWETGYVDDYQFVLIPWSEEKRAARLSVRRLNRQTTKHLP